jgi:putative hydrolase of the HAD superfamily
MPDGQAIPLRAVCWDLGAVLLRTFDWRGRRAWERRLGIRPGGLEQQVFDGDVARQAMLGRATEEDVWADLARAYSLSEVDRVRLRADFFSGDRLDGALIEYIASLRPGLRTALISNAWSSIRRVMGTAAGDSVFDELVISSEVGLAKPDAAIFHLALERLGTPAEGTLFVDDMPRNLSAAHAVGFRTILFNGSRRTIEAIERARLS